MSLSILLMEPQKFTEILALIRNVANVNFREYLGVLPPTFSVWYKSQNILKVVDMYPNTRTVAIFVTYSTVQPNISNKKSAWNFINGVTIATADCTCSPLAYATYSPKFWGKICVNIRITALRIINIRVITSVLYIYIYICTMTTCFVFNWNICC